jgi:hypothetical protein
MRDSQKVAARISVDWWFMRIVEARLERHAGSWYSDRSFPTQMQCFHFCGNRTQSWLEKESSSRRHPTKISNFGRTAYLTNSSNERRKKRRREGEQFALFFANAALVHADAQEKKKRRPSKRSRKIKRARQKCFSTGSSSPRS